MAAEKHAIAQRVARMIQPGSSVSLDTGTTTLEVAKALVNMRNIRVLTTSLAIASVLHTSEGVEVILLGGIVRKTSPDMWGPVTEENINKFRVHLAVLGTDAVTPTGLYTTDVSISRVSRALIDNAKESVVVADSSKFYRTAFVQHASLSDITRLVTDEGCPHDARVWLEKAVKDVIYVPVEKAVIA
jgi:DeoR/GlpR family transcriptional regulator of sugar metabolism